jgi:hypothetical protein
MRTIFLIFFITLYPRLSGQTYLCKDDSTGGTEVYVNITDSVVSMTVDTLLFRTRVDSVYLDSAGRTVYLPKNKFKHTIIFDPKANTIDYTHAEMGSHLVIVKKLNTLEEDEFFSKRYLLTTDD